MGPLIGWLLLAVSVFVEVVPSIFLYPFTGNMWTVFYPTSIGPDTNFRSIIIWFLYMMYSTIIYALIGVLLAKVIEHHEKKTKTSHISG